MDSDNWGLSEQGFRRPNYTELLNATEYKARELFGDGINLTIRSPLGILLRILAWIWSILFSVLEDVYNSRYADTAIGNSLYNLGRNIGMEILTAGKASGYLTITGTPGAKIPAGYLVATAAGLQYIVRDSVVIADTGTILATIRAAAMGPEYNTGAGTVTQIVNPYSVAGVTSVINDADIVGGRWRETDPEYRARYYQSVDYAGGTNADAIRAALLNEVSGIQTAQVYENDTDEYSEAYDLPGHSIEAVVYGGLDEDVAQVIYKSRSGGIQTVGNAVVGVISASGQTIDTRFSRPESKVIWVRIEDLTTDSKFEGNDSIVQALTEHIGDAHYSGLGVGSDVIYMRIPGIISSVAGVVDFSLAIGSDGVNYSTDNIPIGYREKPTVEAETVVIL
ncbi:MAG: baseplate J/gp47 family protein [Lachnospiraceae bacterium]